MKSILSRWSWGTDECFWCGRPVSYERPEGLLANLAATREHLIPRALHSHDSRSNARNIVVACYECNGRRRDSLDFERFVAKDHPRKAEVLEACSRLAANLPRRLRMRRGMEIAGR